MRLPCIVAAIVISYFHQRGGAAGVLDSNGQFQRFSAADPAALAVRVVKGEAYYVESTRGALEGLAG